MSKRPLRFWDLALYTVAISLGSRWIAVAATGGPVSLLMWAAAAVGFLVPLNIATSELVGRFPGEGGIYQWTNDTFGSFAGFITGWVYWTNNLPFFSGALVFIVNALAIASGPHAEAAAKDPMLFTGVCIAIALAVAGLQLMGLGAGKWLSTIGSIANISLFAVLIAAGAYTVYTQGPATDFVHANYAPPINATGALLWSTMVFGLAGAEALAFLRNDVEGGVPKIIRVLMVVGVFLALGYMLGTSGIMALLTPEQTTRLSGLPEAVRTAFDRFGHPELGRPAVLLVALAFLGGYAGWYAVAARLPFVVGVDRYLPKSFGTKNPKTGAPVTSLVVQTIIVIALIVLSQLGGNLKGAYDFLLQMTFVSYTFPFLFLFAVYIAVQKKPAPEGAWVAPGGRKAALWLGWIGFFVTLSAVLCTLVPSPDEPNKLLALQKIGIASVVLILGGVPIWLIAKLRGVKN
jgi:amino acid transporter